MRKIDPNKLSSEDIVYFKQQIDHVLKGKLGEHEYLIIKKNEDGSFTIGKGTKEEAAKARTTMLEIAKIIDELYINVLSKIKTEYTKENIKLAKETMEIISKLNILGLKYLEKHEKSWISVVKRCIPFAFKEFKDKFKETSAYFETNLLTIQRCHLEEQVKKVEKDIIVRSSDFFLLEANCNQKQRQHALDKSNPGTWVLYFNLDKAKEGKSGFFIDYIDSDGQQKEREIKQSEANLTDLERIKEELNLDRNAFELKIHPKFNSEIENNEAANRYLSDHPEQPYVIHFAAARFAHSSEKNNSGFVLSYKDKEGNIKNIDIPKGAETIEAIQKFEDAQKAPLAKHPRYQGAIKPLDVQNFLKKEKGIGIAIRFSFQSLIDNPNASGFVISHLDKNVLIEPSIDNNSIKSVLCSNDKFIGNPSRDECEKTIFKEKNRDQWVLRFSQNSIDEKPTNSGYVVSFVNSNSQIEHVALSRDTINSFEAQANSKNLKEIINDYIEQQIIKPQSSPESDVNIESEQQTQDIDYRTPKSIEDDPTKNLLWTHKKFNLSVDDIATANTKINNPGDWFLWFTPKSMIDQLNNSGFVLSFVDEKGNKKHVALRFNVKLNDLSSIPEKIAEIREEKLKTALPQLRRFLPDINFTTKNAEDYFKTHTDKSWIVRYDATAKNFVMNYLEKVGDDKFVISQVSLPELNLDKPTESLSHILLGESGLLSKLNIYKRQKA